MTNIQEFSDKQIKIKGFKEAYKEITKLRLENYFIYRKGDDLLTWKDINDRISSNSKIKKEIITAIEKRINIINKSKKNTELFIKGKHLAK